MNELIKQLQETPYQIWILLGVFVLSFAVFVTINARKSKKTSAPKPFNIKLLTFGGMCIALSFILSYIKLFSMPQGGSVTLASMFPILLFGFVAGPVPGIIAGTAYGFLQFFQDAFAAHWVSIILDYPVAFAGLGLVALIPLKVKSLELRFVLGTLLAMSFRFLSHVISGAIFFAEYAGDINPWIYSATYNIGYLSVEFLITVVLGVILIKTPIYKSIKVSLSPNKIE